MHTFEWHFKLLSVGFFSSHNVSFVFSLPNSTYVQQHKIRGKEWKETSEKLETSKAYSSMFYIWSHRSTQEQPVHIECLVG